VSGACGCHSAGGVLGGEMGVDRCRGGDAGGGGLHDAGGHVGDVARDPHPGRGQPGRVVLDLAADAEGVPGNGDAEAAQDRCRASNRDPTARALRALRALTAGARR
jgi:hypothetical protein